MNVSHFADAPPSFPIGGVGTIDLNDEVPDIIDLYREREVTKQETINKTILARILALPASKTASPRTPQAPPSSSSS